MKQEVTFKACSGKSTFGQPTFPGGLPGSVMVVAPVPMAVATLGVENETNEKGTLYLLAFQITFGAVFSCMVLHANQLPNTQQS